MEQKTYLIRSEYFKDDVMKNLGWIPFDKEIHSFPTLVYEDGKYAYSKNTYTEKATIKSILTNSKKAITEKGELRASFSEYMMEPISNDCEFSICIVKPYGKGFYRGKGIKIVESEKELSQVVEKLKNTNYVIEKYMQNPLLYKKRKFHIRLNVVFGTSKKALILDKMTEVILAKKKFINDNYDDKDIHDTHYISEKYTERRLKKVFQDKTKKIKEDMKKIVGLSLALFEPTAYPENQHAFEIFGYDFIVDENYKVYLLEINDKVGFVKEGPFSEYFFKKLVKFIEKQ